MITDDMVNAVLKHAVHEYVSALSRCNTPARPEQVAMLRDFVNVKSGHIAEDVNRALTS